jgi:hypothetical protein
LGEAVYVPSTSVFATFPSSSSSSSSKPCCLLQDVDTVMDAIWDWQATAAPALMDAAPPPPRGPGRPLPLGGPGTGLPSPLCTPGKGGAGKRGVAAKSSQPASASLSGGPASAAAAAAAAAAGAARASSASSAAKASLTGRKKPPRAKQPQNISKMRVGDLQRLTASSPSTMLPLAVLALRECGERHLCVCRSTVPPAQLLLPQTDPSIYSTVRYLRLTHHSPLSHRPLVSRMNPQVLVRRHGCTQADGGHHSTGVGSRGRPGQSRRQEGRRGWGQRHLWAGRQGLPWAKRLGGPGGA